MAIVTLFPNQERRDVDLVTSSLASFDGILRIVPSVTGFDSKSQTIEIIVEVSEKGTVWQPWMSALFQGGDARPGKRGSYPSLMVRGIDKKRWPYQRVRLKVGSAVAAFSVVAETED
jgi:hypothetical protein